MKKRPRSRRPRLVLCNKKKFLKCTPSRKEEQHKHEHKDNNLESIMSRLLVANQEFYRDLLPKSPSTGNPYPYNLKSEFIQGLDTLLEHLLELMMETCSNAAFYRLYGYKEEQKTPTKKVRLQVTKQDLIHVQNVLQRMILKH